MKWDLSHSAAAEHRGRTNKCTIRDHSVIYDYTKDVPVRLVVDKNNHLQESSIHFEVLQEYSSGARGERISLGNVKLNLAEYVDASETDGEDGVVRRYLMKDSKINSTLKVPQKYSCMLCLAYESLITGWHTNGVLRRRPQLHCVRSSHSAVSVKSNRTFRPVLKTAPVFGGIAGIIAGEQASSEDIGRAFTLHVFHPTSDNP